MFYAWPLIGRLQLEEHGPKIVFIKGIHNTIADQSHRLSVWPQCQSNSWELLYDKSQQELKKQSETKLDGSLKYNGAN